MRLVVAVSCFAALIAADARATVRCVVPGGGGGCFATITAGLAAASPGDTVRVAAGTYTEYVVLDKNVTLEGGWNAAFTVRDPAANPTTIQPTDATFSVVDIEGDSTDPSKSTPIFDGFTVTGGGGGNHGGGIRIRVSNATVRNCVVTGNRGYLFGGGIWVQRGAPRIEGNRIANNVVNTGGQGGGIMLEDTQAVLIDNVIEGNAIVEGAGLGGGVFLSAGPVVIRGGRIENNTTGPGAPGSPCDGNGGGVAAEFGTGDLLLEGVTIRGNCAATAAGNAGAVYSHIGSLRMRSCLVVSDADTQMYASAVLRDGADTIENSTFAGGGHIGIFADPGQQLLLFNDILVGHSTAVATAQPTMVNGVPNIFFGNTANGPIAVPPIPADPMLDSTFHLMAGSPAIDLGARLTIGPRDVDGDPRYADGGSGRFRLDIGADEFAGPAQQVRDLDSEPADLTIIGPGNPPENPNSSGSNDWIGFAALAHDVSGDGADDLVISAQDFANDFDTDNAGGRLFGLRNFGTRRTGTIDLWDTPADFQVTCSTELQHIGETLVSGDLDDDGTLDLVVGASDTHMMATPTPTVFTLFGGPALAASGAALAPDASGDFAVRAPAASSHAFAERNGLAAGDVSGDGIDDLVIGDSSADDGANADVGAVFVVFGASGLSGIRDLAATPADVTIYGPMAGDGHFAAGFFQGGLALGDLNHDGQLDLVARDKTSAHVLFGPLAPGVRRLATDPGDVVVGGLAAGGVLVMDATGDGIEDLVLGDPNGVTVIAGPLASGQTLVAASAAAYTLTGIDPQSLAAGDVLGDPRPELLLGDFNANLALAIAPASYGPGAVPALEVASLVVQASPSAARYLGFDVTAGDLDGDGRKDLVTTTWQMGALADDPKRFDAGVVFVFYSDPCGDGHVLATEACDDANVAAGDGCSASCRLETDFACSGAPSHCALDVAKLAIGSVVGSSTARVGQPASVAASVGSTLALDHAGLALEFWLSRDAVLDPGQDRQVGGCPLALLTAGGDASCGDDLLVPADLPLQGGQTTGYRWIACVANEIGRSCGLGNSIAVPEPGTGIGMITALVALARRRVRASTR